MYARSLIALAVAGMIVAPTFGQPRTWIDDFTTTATYNSTSYLAPCYYGPGTPSTKYTVVEGLLGDIANERAVSGGGMLQVTNRLDGHHGIAEGARMELTFIGVVNIYGACPDTAGVPWMESTESFTSPELCIYAGFAFNAFQLRASSDLNGQDNLGGAPNFDDDADGTTDEYSDTYAFLPVTGHNGYGGPWPGGPDGAPGVVGVDDDANGTTDNIGETCWNSATDDGDDKSGRLQSMHAMRCDWVTAIGVGINTDPGSATVNLFSMKEIVGYVTPTIVLANEIAPGFYDAYVHYNYVFCGSGTCYGAQMWVETDMGNPAETLGPVTTTLSSTMTGGGLVGFLSLHDVYAGDGYGGYIRRVTWLGNSNFSDTYYVLSGDPRQVFPPIAADFDNDHDVDGQDFMKFSKCFNGSLRPPKADCENPEANFDGDIDVDGQDFMAFSKCFNGSLRRPKCLPPILTNCP